jgi:hypothetical protein
MADRQSLSSFPHDDPVDGDGATALPMRVELRLAESLLEMSQIAVVSQYSQEGKSFG